MQVLNVLIAMRRVLAKGWGQGAFARRFDGAVQSCLKAVPGEACFCLVGAFHHVLGTLQDGALCLAQMLGFGSVRDVQAWNDRLGRTRGQVLALIDRSIRRAMRAEASP